jgi:hypothetical protein
LQGLAVLQCGSTACGASLSLRITKHFLFRLLLVRHKVLDQRGVTSLSKLVNGLLLPLAGVVHASLLVL